MFETALNVEEFAGVVTAKARTAQCAESRPGAARPVSITTGRREPRETGSLSSPLRSLTLTVECLAHLFSVDSLIRLLSLMFGSRSR